MGKSANSCLKIMTCAGDAADNEDHEPMECKASSDKRRWSFRKRSARHRVLSNSVISEPFAVIGDKKESPEASDNNLNPHADSFTPEKIPVSNWTDETPTLPVATPKSEVVDTFIATEKANNFDSSVQESVALVIQSAVRRYLAQKEFHKLKNVVKLQAAVRGHLVRRQAVGTLRCVQAIVKMQALVRARRVRQLVGKSTNQEKLDEKFQTYTERLNPLAKEDSVTKYSRTLPSTEKLLTNGFARQLLESTPKTKPIHISFDPSKSDSAWKWLERWMTITSSDIGQQQEFNLNTDYQKQGEISKPVASEVAHEVPITLMPFSQDSKSNLGESLVTAMDKEDQIIRNAGEFEFQDPISVPYECFSSMKDGLEQSLQENEASGVVHTKGAVSLETSTSISSQMAVESEATGQSVLDGPCEKPEFDREKSKRTIKRLACESLETESKKLVVGSKKTCNPTFVAAQSKFEELSSPLASGRPINSYEDVAIESRAENLTSQEDSFTKTDISLTENSFSHDPRVRVAASECGTEISISSTLDSPDRSEAEGGEIILELGTLEKRGGDANGGANNAYNQEEVNNKMENPSADSEGLHLEKPEEIDGNPSHVILGDNSMQMEQQVAKPTALDMQIHVENVTDQQGYSSSPEGSPRSHVTATESHGTPSSQISINAKKSKKDHSIPVKRQRPQLVGKRSPTNANIYSGARSSIEHLPKDSKNGKRRNSFGTPKHDHVDQEPRVSSSSSLPNYMQATESARAKVHYSNSPKSSPDVHDKDSQIKKRHSLPIVIGKQDSSPRMQRSTSQVQPNLKGNGTHSPHNSAERKWQR